MNPYVFVVGCPRSGTTLLQRLLDAHPQLAVINETLWITREADRCRRVSSELVERLYEYPRFQRLDLDRDDVEQLIHSEASASYEDFVSAVFDLYGRNRGKPFVGDKSPGYVREVPGLHSLWPSARFIHLIRDGRDVHLSVAGWKKAAHNVGQFATWAHDPVATTALWWERSVRLGREAGERLGSAAYCEVRYEQLTAHPDRECRRLCAFLDLPYDDTMLRFHEGRTRNEPGLTSKRAWLPPVAGLRDWTADMTPDDAECFEAVASDLLDELGYPRRHTGFTNAASERASRVRSEFTDDIRARGRCLPDRWSA